MLAVYRALASQALDRFGDVVTGASFVGGTQASPNKLRLALVDGSYVDIWLTEDGDYAFHGEQRRHSGRLYRWDNAPHYPELSTFPKHFHNGEEEAVAESRLSAQPDEALREVLTFVRRQLA